MDTMRCTTEVKTYIFVNGIKITCNCTAFINGFCTNEGKCQNQKEEN